MSLRVPGPPAMFLFLAGATAWLCAAMPVFSQEAYYWTYAQHPALSYLHDADIYVCHHYRGPKL